MNVIGEELVLTRRNYLLMKAMEYGAGTFVAIESVASTALAHPEWDMTETKSYAEWENE